MSLDRVDLSLKLPGYSVTTRGLEDVSKKPPEVLSRKELRALIQEAAHIQGTAMAVADLRLTATIAGKMSNTTEVEEPLIFGGMSLAFAAFLPRAFADALPHQSVVFRYARFFRDQPVQMKEFYARKYRFGLCVTNPRFLMNTTGCFVFAALAVWCKDPRKYVGIKINDARTADAIAYRDHTEEILQSLWRIYYNHPAYSVEKERAETGLIRKK